MVMKASVRRYLNNTRQEQLGQSGILSSVRGRQASLGVGDEYDMYDKQMYNDIGISMTPQQYAEIRAELDSSKEKRQKALSLLSEQEKEILGLYDKEYGKLASQKIGELSPDMISSQMNMVPVRVVKGNTVESVYTLPKDVVDKLNKESLNQGEGSLVGNWVDDGQYYNIDVVPAGTDDAYGKEVHEMISGGQAEVQRYIDEQLKHEQAKANMVNRAIDTQLGMLSSQKSGFQSEIDDSRKAVAAAEAEEQRILDEGKKRYEEKIDNARATALSIGYGGSKR